MTRFSRLLSQSLLGLALFCALTACGGPSHDIVGKWRASDDPKAVIWEFSNNGAVVIGNSRGRYTFGDNHRIKIEMPFGRSVYQIEFPQPDQMTFRDSSSSKLTFTRIR